MRLVSAGLSRVGHVREVNEDGVGVFDDDGVVVVCDAMGGSMAGTFVTPVVVSGYRAMLRAYAASHPEPEAPADAAALADITARVDRAVLQSCESIGPLGRGAGAAACALWLRGDTLHWAHLGDTMLHRLRGGSAEPQWSPHTLEAEWSALYPGQRMPDDASNLGNVITRAFGVGDSAPASGSLALRPGDVLLASTDGLWKELAPEVLSAALRGARDPADALSTLFAALEAGAWRDNASAVVIRVDEGPGDAAATSADGGDARVAAPSWGALPSLADDAEVDDDDDRALWERLCTRERLPPRWGSDGVARFAAALHAAPSTWTATPPRARARALARRGGDALDAVEALARELRARLRPWGFAGRDAVVWAPLPDKAAHRVDLREWADAHADEREAAAWCAWIDVAASHRAWVAQQCAGLAAWRARVVVPRWNRAVDAHPYGDLPSPWEPLHAIACAGAVVLDVTRDAVWVAAAP